ncbi:MAG: hypothetical protein M1825_003281 [Sarcosagium campestre]|nr:MAG: hypothetical protein M1825_003281 [Sarcosagium campestre]
MPPQGQFNTKSPTIKRILREASELSSSPSADYLAQPLDSNLFEWHFTVRGPPCSPYAKGIYHGRIILPPTYPLRPPSFRFMTPSGRFETNREICLSISGHHEETWQPAWGIRTALVALRAFMAGDAKGQLGGLECENAARELFAKESHVWTCSSGCGGRSNAMIMADVEREAEKAEDNKDKAADVEVPKELKLGYRAELASSASDSRNDQGDEGHSAKVLSSSNREGDVRAAFEEAAVSNSFRAKVADNPPTTSMLTEMEPQRHLPTAVPTRTIPLQRTEPMVGNTDGVPEWVDRAIIGVFVSLAALILKKLLQL